MTTSTLITPSPQLRGACRLIQSSGPSTLWRASHLVGRYSSLIGRAALEILGQNPSETRKKAANHECSCVANGNGARPLNACHRPPQMTWKKSHVNRVQCGQAKGKNKKVTEQLHL